jgi:hypothetical protein
MYILRITLSAAVELCSGGKIRLKTKSMLSAVKDWCSHLNTGLSQQQKHSPMLDYGK